ncbi:MFS transporter [Saccharopolyspora elongata]|uniref:MFS transporter n=1 Tax=Saccharopolyspora elongata TaxID=2530387 RepID=A0A4R4YCI1_9PSEU|nr:MFS transporter [Saccharopolyspora elongata]TDD42315.1 MFS transporter [Saccharopolyspora elongata]
MNREDEHDLSGERKFRSRKTSRAIFASTLSVAIEWYDYYLYGLVSGLVFAHVFFPNASPLVGTVQAFGIFGVGFVARPIGAVLFGHLGDRVGRKTALMWSTLCMGIPSFVVAFVPSYETIGIGGAIILTFLRLMQGVGLGGQWAGAVLLSMESGSARRSGFFASWAQAGSPIGLVLANLALIGTSAGMSGEAFLSWGWRIPFLISGVLISVIIYMRFRVDETPEFSRLSRSSRTERNPVLGVLRSNWREVLLAALVRTSEMAPFYIFTTFVVTYGVHELLLDQGFVLGAVLVASVLSVGWILLFGHISDRIGRRSMYIIGAAATGVWGFGYFALLDTRIPALVVIAIVVSMIPHDMQYGPQAAFIAESFPPRVRYSGAALGSQLASIISGGPAPIIATALLARFGSSTAVAIYLLLCAVVGGVAAFFLRAHGAETKTIEQQPRFPLRLGADER